MRQTKACTSRKVSISSIPFLLGAMRPSRLVIPLTMHHAFEAHKGMHGAPRFPDMHTQNLELHYSDCLAGQRELEALSTRVCFHL